MTKNKDDHTNNIREKIDVKDLSDKTRIALAFLRIKKENT